MVGSNMTEGGIGEFKERWEGKVDRTPLPAQVESGASEVVGVIVDLTRLVHTEVGTV